MPRRALGTWIALMIVLSVAGIGAQNSLHSVGTQVEGTPSALMQATAEQRFGPAADNWLMLRGDPKKVAAARKLLTARLAKINVALIGPVLEQGPGKIILAARMHDTYERRMRVVSPHIRRIVDATPTTGLEVRVGGAPDLGNAIIKGSVDDIKRFELITAPLLLIILLLVFRTPLAAGLPLLIGLTTIGGAAGVLAIVNRFYDLDVFAMNLASMMGLALGVDYSLLLVSRYREERALGKPPPQAAARAADTAGETVLSAGIIVILGMSITGLVAPGDLLFSAAIGVCVAAALSVIGGLVAIPALLSIAGDKIDVYPLCGRLTVPGTGRFAARISRPIRRPRLTGALGFGLLAALSLPTLAITTGIPDFTSLPSNARARIDYAAMAHAFGDAWNPPYRVLVTVDKGTITDPHRLKVLADWEQKMARRSDVASVLGPGVIESRTRQLAKAGAKAKSAAASLKRAARDQQRLRDGLTRADAGVRTLRAGLGEAAQGASQLAVGGHAAAGGARRMDAGLVQAKAGAAQLHRGLTAGVSGADALAAGARRVERGNAALAKGLATAVRRSAAAGPGATTLADGLASGVKELARLKQPVEAVQNQLLTAEQQLDALPAAARSDPHVRSSYDALRTAGALIDGKNPSDGSRFVADYDGLIAAIDTAVTESQKAADGAGDLRSGLGELRAGLVRARDGATAVSGGAERVAVGAQQEADGLRQLQSGAATLEAGLTTLSGGGRQISDGVARLQAGADTLAAGLGNGARKAVPLSAGLATMQRGVTASAKAGKSLEGQLDQTTQLVRATGSGYLPLALIETGGASDRAALGAALNLDRGGNAAIVTVFGRGNTVVAGHPLRPILERELAPLGRAMDGVAQIGGPATEFQDFDRLSAARLPILIAVAALVTWLALSYILGSLLLAAIAVGLNLLTVSATFGVLVLMFQGSAPLGGPGYIDIIGLMGVFGLVFALSIDYTMFLLLRMVEGYRETGNTEAAIAHGLRTTAGVVTGAAAVMVGVFAAFSSAQMINLRQMGVGLAVAVLIDATLVRLVLLPVAIRAGGDACWRMPRRLSRPRPASPPREQFEH